MQTTFWLSSLSRLDVLAASGIDEFGKGLEKFMETSCISGYQPRWQNVKLPLCSKAVPS